MIEIAQKYYESGLSVIPVKQDKSTIGTWAENIKDLLEPKKSFSKAWGIGLVAGRVSGNVEVIDVDEKYSIDGKLMQQYCDVIADTGTDVMGKLVIEKTQNGGYHLIYKCSEISGNSKLANRYATGDELVQNENKKQYGLIETRGEGGFIVCAPSPGYEIIQGDLLNIPEITPTQRRLLLDCAKSLNEVPETTPVPKSSYDGIDPFAEYNDSGDVQSLLEKHGWDYVKEVKGNLMYKRPGSNSIWSAGYDPVRKLMYVFTSSTVFEPNKAYNNSQILCFLEFNKDYKECAKYLKDRGYGTQSKKITQDKPKNSLLATTITESAYLHQVRSGTFEMGKTTGFKALDEFWRIKDETLTITNGFDNCGKTQVELYLKTLGAVYHNMNFLIYTGENRAGNVFRKIMEFYLCKPISEMTESEYKKAKEFADTHFSVIKNTELYRLTDLLEVADEAISSKKIHRFMVDPWNSLNRDKKISLNPHDHDEEALRIARHWINTRHVALDILCHPNTEAYRNKWGKDHPRYAGMLQPPQKGDTEGGAKFSSKSDDFKTIHRYTQHSEEWRFCEIHVRKIKETETGGRQTFIDSPFRMRMLVNQCGFEDEYGFNPILKTNSEVISRPVIEIDENVYGKKIETDSMPF